MKETKRNNIVRYVISTALVAISLLIASLISMSVEWLTDKIGWYVIPIFCIICLIYLVWRVGKGITVSDEEDDL